MPHKQVLRRIAWQKASYLTPETPLSLCWAVLADIGIWSFCFCSDIMVEMNILMSLRPYAKRGHWLHFIWTQKSGVLTFSHYLALLPILRSTLQY